MLKRKTFFPLVSKLSLGTRGRGDALMGVSRKYLSAVSSLPPVVYLRGVNSEI
jgi:hypothetical protein